MANGYTEIVTVTDLRFERILAGRMATAALGQAQEDRRHSGGSRYAASEWGHIHQASPRELSFAIHPSQSSRVRNNCDPASLTLPTCPQTPRRSRRLSSMTCSAAGSHAFLMTAISAEKKSNEPLNFDPDGLPTACHSIVFLIENTCARSESNHSENLCAHRPRRTCSLPSAYYHSHTFPTPRFRHRSPVRT
jgi:hypothetical protein